ncbi:thioredoxin family protein [Pontibacillus yanchengensis]|uniref:Thioredoxin family protein n=2 Tax=Pontibacillus yanchengensis TaxID=462910 RepID=A0ACC7VJ51_9BACI|nr:thioredoxin family protein [Pontibacillus yanchengensis]MYL33632.1 thioredoxin family protein [Pontibacillus yanchengensis]MYL54145.1 thioredoxin family protein [Pontibacillus yanchengensis]
MSLNEWFDKGMTPQEYVSSMTKNQDNLMHVYNHFTLPEDQRFFDKVKEQNLRVVVLTEDWCGDAMLNIPILLKISEQTNMDVRLLNRDENLELMDQYLTNGSSRAIPIFIFINEKGEEVAVWGPRAPELQQLVDNGRENLPSKDNPIFEEKQKEMILFLTKAYRENEELWSHVYNSIKSTLK